MTSPKTEQQKILVVAPSRGSRGGISSSVDRLCRSEVLKQRGTVWLQTMDDRSALHKFSSFVLALVRYPFYLSKASIVHVHTSSGTSFYRKSIFCLIAPLFGKKVLLHVHPAHFVDFAVGGGWLRHFILKMTFRSADSVIVLTSSIRSMLENVIPGRNYYVLPNPCPLDTLTESELHDRDRVILFAGKLMEAKGCGELLEAFAGIYKTDSDLQLVMAGNGDVEKYRALASQLGVQDRVSFPGWLEGEDLIEQYRKAAIFCLPSYSEGLPMSLLEAMSQGTAVVTTPVGGIPDVIVDGINGLLVSPQSVGSLEESLRRLLRNEGLKKKLAVNALNTVKSGYEIGVVGKKLESIYSQIEMRQR